jgi:ankyrin repeat protein
MTIEKELAAVIEKYRMHFQFLGIEITDVNQRGAFDDTLMHFAAEVGSTEDIDVLAASGADIDAIGDLGNTPLHNAARLGNIASVKRLLELGADPERINVFGQSAEVVAISRGHDKLAEVIRNFKTGGL